MAETRQCTDLSQLSRRVLLQRVRYTRLYLMRATTARYKPSPTRVSENIDCVKVSFVWWIYPNPWPKTHYFFKYRYGLTYLVSGLPQNPLGTPIEDVLTPTRKLTYRVRRLVINIYNLHSRLYSKNKSTKVDAGGFVQKDPKNKSWGGLSARI